MEISKVTQGGVPSFPSEGKGKAAEVKTQPIAVVKAVESTDFAQKQLTKDEVERMVAGLNEIISSSNSHLKFQYHEKLKQYYITIVDNKSNEVVREIPPRKILDVVASIWEQIGIIVDRKI